MRDDNFKKTEAIRAFNRDGEIITIDPFFEDGKPFNVAVVAGVGAYRSSSELLNEITKSSEGDVITHRSFNENQ